MADESLETLKLELFEALKLESFETLTLESFETLERPTLPPETKIHDEDPTEYPAPTKVAIIMSSLYIAIFLVALDRTIIAVAIPKITNQFHSTDDIGWYGSAYMLTSCGFVLLYGRIYTFFSTKLTFLSGIILFEIGSAICGAAPNSTVLIVGRALAGLGSSGIFTGAITIMMHTVPLHRRPMFQGLFGACFGVASVAGPLLGGAFTQSKATWRWCFYINLPLGAFTTAVSVFLLDFDDKKPNLSLKQKLMNLDPLGTILFLPSIICLLLALQWGGTKYAWSEGHIIALLVVFAILFVVFIAIQYFTRNTTATVPARILFQRSVAFGGFFQFLVGSTMLTISIYLPLWFQAVKGVSAVKSGIDTIPLVLSVVVGSILCGGIVQHIGYYTPFMIVGAILMSIGAGLLTTWTTSTSHPSWIGHQVAVGFGIGLSMQQTNLAVQTVLQKKDIPTGTSFLSFCQTLGGAVFVAVGQNVFIDKFIQELGEIGGINAAHVVDTGATALKNAVPKELLPRVLEAYNYSIVKGPFFASLIVACLTIIGALGMEWRSVKEGIPQQLTEKNIGNDEETASSVSELPAVSEKSEI